MGTGVGRRGGTAVVAPARRTAGSLRPGLPRAVQTLQFGGLLNALGNGLVVPFLFIYLHEVRGFGLGLTGLVVGTGGVTGIVTTPLSGTASIGSARAAPCLVPSRCSPSATAPTSSCTRPGRPSRPPSWPARATAASGRASPP